MIECLLGRISTCSSIVQHLNLMAHGHVQIAVVQYSIARHSELVTNITTICVAVQ